MNTNVLNSLIFTAIYMWMQMLARLLC